ncbi:hypothetical protein PR048_030563 [Dryococelus australis]|uniref:Uncharacterized protein n=1 Tax=Dryococelus australis TaxID=614101 RepID=A0ABQ9G9B5_9NEOP|nr:hypothetical protein PR048_030563 [Dryococelus australis]
MGAARERFLRSRGRGPIAPLPSSERRPNTSLVTAGTKLQNNKDPAPFILVFSTLLTKSISPNTLSHHASGNPVDEVLRVIGRQRDPITSERCLNFNESGDSEGKNGSKIGSPIPCCVQCRASVACGEALRSKLSLARCCTHPAHAVGTQLCSRDRVISSGITAHNSLMRDLIRLLGGVANIARANRIARNAKVRWGEEGLEIPEKTRLPAASSGTIPTCENPGMTPQGIEPGSPRNQSHMCESSSSALKEMFKCPPSARTHASTRHCTDIRMRIRVQPSWRYPQRGLNPATSDTSCSCATIYRPITIHHSRTDKGKSVDIKSVPQKTLCRLFTWSDYLPLTKANRVRIPAGIAPRIFARVESGWTMPPVGGFSRGSPGFPPPPRIPAPLLYSSRFIITGSQALSVKRRSYPSTTFHTNWRAPRKDRWVFLGISRIPPGHAFRRRSYVPTLEMRWSLSGVGFSTQHDAATHNKRRAPPNESPGVTRSRTELISVRPAEALKPDSHDNPRLLLVSATERFGSGVRCSVARIQGSLAQCILNGSCVAVAGGLRVNSDELGNLRLDSGGGGGGVLLAEAVDSGTFDKPESIASEHPPGSSRRLPSSSKSNRTPPATAAQLPFKIRCARIPYILLLILWDIRYWSLCRLACSVSRR